MGLPKEVTCTCGGVISVKHVIVNGYVAYRCRGSNHKYVWRGKDCYHYRPCEYKYTAAQMLVLIEKQFAVNAGPQLS